MRHQRPAWEILMGLAHSHWSIDLRITRNGVGDKAKRSFGVWARAGFWRGRTADITLHAHAIIPVDPASSEEAILKMRGAIDRVAEACRRAEAEYTSSFPCQLADRLPDGRIALASSSWADRHWDTGRTDLFPKQTVPGEPGDFASRDPDRILKTLHALSLNHHAEAGLDPYARPGMVHELHRTWQVTTRLARHEFEGVRLSHKPVVFRSEMLFEDVAADLLFAAEASVERAFRNAAPPCLRGSGRWRTLSGGCGRASPRGSSTMKMKTRMIPWKEPDRHEQQAPTG